MKSRRDNKTAKFGVRTYAVTTEAPSSVVVARIDDMPRFFEENGMRLHEDVIESLVDLVLSVDGIQR